MVTTALHIPTEPDAVFDTLAQGDRYADWVVGAAEIRAVDEGFPEPGTRIHHTMGALALMMSGETEVLAAEPARLLELHAHARAFQAYVRFFLEPDEVGTWVTMEEEGSNDLSRRLMRAIAPFVRARNAETLWRLRAQVTKGGIKGTPTTAETRSEVPRWLGDVTARAFGLAAALRGRRALHPRGVARRGWARPDGRGSVLLAGDAHPAIVRFSRGGGFPARLPDVNGIAVRFLDGLGPGHHRDVLLATCVGPAARWALAPAISFEGVPFSSILPYRFQDESVYLTAEVHARAPSLAALGAADAVRVTLGVAAPGSATEPVAELTLDEVIEGDDLHFDPTTADEHLAPRGLLHALRDPAYAASQAVRRGLDHDHSGTR